MRFTHQQNYSYINVFIYVCTMLFITLCWHLKLKKTNLFSEIIQKLAFCFQKIRNKNIDKIMQLKNCKFYSILHCITLTKLWASHLTGCIIRSIIIRIDSLVSTTVYNYNSTVICKIFLSNICLKILVVLFFIPENFILHAKIFQAKIFHFTFIYYTKTAKLANYLCTASGIKRVSRVITDDKFFRLET